MESLVASSLGGFVGSIIGALSVEVEHDNSRDRSDDSRYKSGRKHTKTGRD